MPCSTQDFLFPSPPEHYLKNHHNRRDDESEGEEVKRNDVFVPLRYSFEGKQMNDIKACRREKFIELFLSCFLQCKLSRTTTARARRELRSLRQSSTSSVGLWCIKMSKKRIKDVWRSINISRDEWTRVGMANVVRKVVYRWAFYNFMSPPTIELQHYRAIIFPTFHSSRWWFCYSNICMGK